MATPQRTCIGCRAKSEQSALLRISATGILLHGPSMGRSAYICPNRSCADAAFKKGAIERVLRKNLSQALREQIQAELIEITQKTTP